MLGVLNFSNIALYVKAHILLKDSPAIVFCEYEYFGRVTWNSLWRSFI